MGGACVAVSTFFLAMARGPKKHLKRVYAPSHWMLDKLRGDWAPRPSCGPHKLRECLPLSILLRQRLKYALTYKEVKLICMQRLVKVDNKVRTDMCYPAGFMDVVSLEKTNQHFRLLYDTKGRFVIHQIHKDDARRPHDPVSGSGRQGERHGPRELGDGEDREQVQVRSRRYVHDQGRKQHRAGRCDHHAREAPGVVRDHPREGCEWQQLLHADLERDGHRPGFGIR